MSDRLSGKIRRDFQRLMGVEREERGPVARKKVRRSGWTFQRSVRAVEVDCTGVTVNRIS